MSDLGKTESLSIALDIMEALTVPYYKDTYNSLLNQLDITKEMYAEAIGVLQKEYDN